MTTFYLAVKKLNYNLRPAILVIVISCLIFSSCAEVSHVQNCLVDKPYGFWSGLWHGMIAPFSFFGSLISDKIAMYAINNNGAWYNFGFVIGAGIIFGGGTKASNK
ncbi:MAG TPA: hypothetical protein VGK38_15670 [Prolixibacteraceae bacterium]